MVLPVRTLRGIVLNREESGEGYLRLKVFSPDEGLVLVFKPTATKRSPGPLPDFFDELEVYSNVVVKGKVGDTEERFFFRRASTGRTKKPNL